MRESRPYGSVRGALSNERSYRDFCKHGGSRRNCDPNLHSEPREGRPTVGAPQSLALIAAFRRPNIGAASASPLAALQSGPQAQVASATVEPL